MTDNYSMAGLLEYARWSLKNEYGLIDAQHPHDLIAEVADGSVPIHSYDLLQYGSANWDLLTGEPELGPAFDGSPTPINIIAANIYEAVSNFLHQEIENILEELKEETS